MTISVVEDSIQAAGQQRRRLFAACVIVLVTFLARAAFDFLRAFSAIGLQYNPSCGHCDSCQTQQSLINTWLLYTPELQCIIVALSSPLTLVASLWLITTAHARALVIAADVKRVRRGSM